MTDKDAVTTAALVISEWMDKVTGEYKDLNLIYDEQLTIESSLTKLRAKRQRDAKQGAAELPLLAFKRSPLKFPGHGMNRRSQVTRVYNPTVNTGTGKKDQKPIFYRPVYGLLEMQFMHFSQKMEDEEAFEIDYMTEDHLSAVKNLTVNIPDLGDFNYFASYSPIEEKLINSKDIYYKVVQGTVSLLGWYFTIEGAGSIITEIHAKIESFKTEVMADIDIVATE